MKILIVSASPHLCTRLGRMNRDAINYFSAKNEVSSAVWHLNENWVTKEDDQYKYKLENGTYCNLYPIPSNMEDASTKLYDLVNDIKPEIVLSIGDYLETAFVYTLKAINQEMFKWVGVFTINSVPINDKFIEMFDAVDYPVCTNKIGTEEINKRLKDKCKYIPYGPDHKKFYEDSLIRVSRNIDSDGMVVMNSSKNSQSCNLGNALEAANNLQEIYFNFHLNYSDPGEYDLKVLLNRFKNVNIDFEKFSSVNDGMTDEELNEQYNRSDVFIDVSARSSTALSVLEAMGCGCVPVGVNGGAIGEIISLMPKDMRFIIPSIKYIGSREETLYISSAGSIEQVLLELLDVKKRNNCFFIEMGKESRRIAARFSKDLFLRKLDVILDDAKNNTKKYFSIEEIS